MAAFQPGILTRNPWVPRRPINVREYHLMGETGILHEDDRVELIDRGEQPVNGRGTPWTSA